MNDGTAAPFVSFQKLLGLVNDNNVHRSLLRFEFPTLALKFPFNPV
ncbi:MAG TPA: hypothetical protein VK789_14280 [Bryobacteraceae bacterium]|jgi:hypothetical protein|nr:hypothetical protein [Bryobacteraceae bacterium]